MNKKKLTATLLAGAMTATCLSGCSLLTTESKQDMANVVAEIDITTSDAFVEEFGSEIAKKVPALNVTKRELIAYFVNSGYSYISSGMSYEDTFESLMSSMVNYKIIVQYSMAYLLKNEKDLYTKEYTGADGDTLAVLEYLLDVDEDNDPATPTYYQKAVYALNQSINSAIDSRESSVLTSLDSSSSATEDEDRTTPDGVQTTKEDYYEDETVYTIYTGWNEVNEKSSYQKQDGSTKETRKRAYNSFLHMLEENNLTEGEDLKNYVGAGKDISAKDKDGNYLSAYYEAELITQLESMLSTRLSKAFEAQAEKNITENVLQERYEELLAVQKKSDATSFESTIESLSDSSFALYCPEGATDDDSTKFGFVYNILLPFSSSQSFVYEQYKSDDGLTKAELYNKRAELLKEVKSGDQRASWITGSTDYSYVKDGKYYFFEQKDQYEEIGKYYGNYPFNGEVKFDAESGKVTATAEKLSITSFLTEMETYFNDNGFEASGVAVTDRNLHKDDVGSVTSGADGLTATYMKGDIVNEKGEIDYSKFVYYVGQVKGLENTSMRDVIDSETDAYKAMSIFNELMFAYSTDTGCLNTYLGYNVSKYSTSFVGEFEYAAKLAISMGVGTYTVAPSDYGWHIIYCTYAFDEGDLYSDIAWSNIENEGTFEYYFYEALKSNLVSSYQNVLQNKQVNVYNKSPYVTIHEDRYSDYTSLENTYTSSDTQS